ncbi:Uncharacterised protein [Mycoplasmopsis synoviae]|uniref:Uncharacterized protein n=1 Tax=Mycoplasmopsis synoviae TaxID=2109 RepID=A0A3B0P8P7_MYCSY|nr:Uncharacterised protein [Mycoplasmopsis synoviae]
MLSRATRYASNVNSPVKSFGTKFSYLTWITLSFVVFTCWLLKNVGSNCNKVLVNSIPFLILPQ